MSEHGFVHLIVGEDKIDPVAVFPSTMPNPWLLEIRQMAHLHNKARGVSVSEPFEHVVAVGALSQAGKINYPDFLMLEDAIAFCAQKEMFLADPFHLTLLNLNERGEGDFLEFKGPADLVILCCVFDGPGWDESFAMCRQSPRHIPGAWHDAAVRVGARAIVAYGYGYGDEVDANTLKPRRGQPLCYETIGQNEPLLADRKSSQRRDFLVRQKEAQRSGPK